MFSEKQQHLKRIYIVMHIYFKYSCYYENKNIIARVLIEQYT